MSENTFPVTGSTKEQYAPAATALFELKAGSSETYLLHTRGVLFLKKELESCEYVWSIDQDQKTATLNIVCTFGEDIQNGALHYFDSSAYKIVDPGNIHKDIDFTGFNDYTLTVYMAKPGSEIAQGGTGEPVKTSRGTVVRVMSVRSNDQSA